MIDRKGSDGVSSGKTHDKINHFVIYFTVIIFVLLLMYLTVGEKYTAIFLLLITGYHIGSYCFGPDLDIKSKPYRRWGKLRFIWKPYQKVFKHRSFWTHSILISDVVRIIYLISIIFPFYAGVVVLLNLNSNSVNEMIVGYLNKHKIFHLSFFSGIVLASTIHIISDKISTSRKRIKTKKKKR